MLLRPEPSSAVVLRNGALRFSARHWQAHGESQGVVLALHGFPDTADTFAPLVARITDAGFDVLAPLMRGYEPSSIPADGDYQVASLADDIATWLEQPPLAGRPVHLLGHDWGAVAGYAAAARLGDRLDTFTALAIPPLGHVITAALRTPQQLRQAWYQYLALLPLAEPVFRHDDYALIDHLWRSWSPGLPRRPAHLRAVKAVLRQPGVLTAVLGYYRALYGLHHPRRRETEALFRAAIHAPTLILHGEDDGCMASALFPRCVHAAQFAGGVARDCLPGCGHWLHLEEPDIVTARWLEFVSVCRDQAASGTRLPGGERGRWTGNAGRAGQTAIASSC